MIPRSEHPTPQFERKDWINLNGEWEFEIDGGDSGRARGLHKAEKLEKTIIVPFCPESKLSGINHLDFMAAVWYRRTFTLPEGWRGGRRTILHIGACDYQTEVWVNGVSAGTHVGGYVSFSFDITDLLQDGENVVTICARDDVRSGNQPVGKQCREYHSVGCHYTRTTGIWQTVWLENLPSAYIKRVKYLPDLEKSELRIEAECVGADGMILCADSSFAGEATGSANATVISNTANINLKLSKLHLWSAGCGNLYDLDLSLGEDRVKSYFGMRNIAYSGGKILLNGEPVFQRLVLDQGFYPDGVYTAPTDAELEADVRRSLDMGFNGARLHQKVFEPRFLYHCDRLGYLVWGEHANWGLDISRPEAWKNFLPEWLEILQRDFNHPAIVGWCPLNETQRDQNAAFVTMLYHMTKAFDPTRPMIDASGWYHCRGVTDIMDTHDYEQDPAVFKARYDALIEGGTVNITPSHHGGPARMERPVFISEFGGIGWNPGDKTGWGYGDAPKTEREFIARYKGLTDALLDNPAICAFCYTQLTDVEQELNGLYYYDRRPKFDPAVIRAITSRKAAIETPSENRQ